MDTQNIVAARKTLFNVQIGRGVAALLVLFTHSSTIVDPSLLGGFFVKGHIGVDFFFVISGFIIYYVSYRDIGNPASFPQFAKRRFVRIFPIYWLYTAVIVALSTLKEVVTGNPLTSWVEPGLLGIVKSFTLYPTNYVENVMPVLPVAWTLTHELLFYFIFGLSIILGWRYLIGVVLVWLATIVFYNFFWTGTKGPLLIVLTNFRNVEFLFGLLVGYLVVHNRLISSKFLAKILLWLSVAAVFGAWLIESNGGEIFEKSYGLAFGLPFALLVYSMISYGDVKPGKPFVDALLFIGNASYSIYLTHYLVIALFVNVFHKIFANPYIEFSIAVVEGLIIGCLCYKYVEMPMIEKVTAWIGLKRKVVPVSQTVRGGGSN